MHIVLSCPGCGKRYELDRKLAGKKARCRKCSIEFRIPDARDSQAPAKAPPANELEADSGGTEVDPAYARPPAGESPRAPARPLTLGRASADTGQPPDAETVVDPELASMIMASFSDAAEASRVAKPAPTPGPGQGPTQGAKPAEKKPKPDGKS
jgi:hypothetical protein